MRIFLKIVVGFALLYLFLSGGLLAAMYQPPDTFGRIMARMPGPLFGVLPFEHLWMVARKGQLRIGNAAPDFSLETNNHKERITLSTMRGEKPVVLVFGSYT